MEDQAKTNEQLIGELAGLRQRIAELEAAETERKQAEGALRGALAELTVIHQNVPIAMMLVDRDRRVRKVNGSAALFATRPAEEMLGLRGGEALRCLHHLDDPQGCGFGPACATCTVRLAVLDTFATRESRRDVEAWLPFPWGDSVEERCLLVSTAYLQMDDTEQVLVCAQDITDRKRAEEALRESGARYQAIVEAFDGLIYICSQDYRVEFMNKQLVERTGYDGTGELCYKVLHDRDSICPWCVNDRVFASETVRWEVQSPKDNRWYYVVNTPIYHTDGSMSKQAMILNISERKQAEDELRASEARFRIFVDHAADAFFLHDNDEQGTILDVNRQACESLGYSREELVGMTPNDFDADLDRSVIDQMVVRLDAGEMIAFDTWHRRRDGSVFPVEVRSRPFQQGERRLAVSLARDMTERKQMEEALAVQEREFRTLAENSPDNIARYDANCRTLYVNPTLEKTLGRPASEMLGTTPIEAALIDEAREYQEKIAEVFETGKDDEMDLILPDRGEGVRYHSIRFVAERGADGTITGVQTIGRDITERKQAEVERQAYVRFLESMDRVNRAIQGTNDLEQMMSGVLDIVLSIFDCDRAFLMYPCDPDASSWFSPMERTRPQYPGILALGIGEAPMNAEVARTFRIMLDTDGPVKFGPGTSNALPVDVSECFDIKSCMSMALYPKVDKPWRFGIHQCSYARIWTPEDERLFQEIGRRLTDALTSLLVYRDLQESELRYREIFENTSDVIVITEVTKDGRFRLLNFNPAWETIIGLGRTELVGRFLKDLTADETARTVLEQYHVCLEKKAPIDFETGLATATGYWYLHTTLIPVSNAAGNIYRLVGVSRNITERKRAEEALRESERKWRSLYENLPGGSFIVNDHYIIEDVNDILCTLTGFTREELVGQLCDIICPKGPHKCPILDLGKKRIDDDETAVKTKDGQFVPIIKSARRISMGTKEGIVENFQDITERRRVEAEREHLLAQVREQAHRVQEVVDTVPEGVLLLDSDCRVVLTNPLGQQDLVILAGVQVGDILTRLGDRPLAELLTSPPKGLWHEVSTENRSFQALARPVENDATPKGWVLVIRDVTQQYESERRIQQQERLAAIGQLAAGIAHDFNNIMAVIVLHAQMAARSAVLSDRDRGRLATIDEQAHHATRLIQQILDFSRRAVLERQPLDLLLLLKEQVQLLKRTLPEHISIRLDYGHGEYTVNADPTRMQQMMMNLAVNARDAMPEGGVLSIALERITIEPGALLPLPELAAGDWIKLSVADTGIGVSPETLPHIFEPFYTTKPPDRGSGLGLAQVYGIVAQHEGHIDVEAQVGAGTTFTVYLPALEVPPTTPLSLDVSIMPQGKGEVVLVVEDNVTLRATLRETLAEWGYQVREAADGMQALALLEESGGVADLVLSDAVMPEMGGVAMVHALRERGWVMPVILLSGYPQRQDLTNLRAYGVRAWLSKPPSMKELAKVVAQALSTD